MQNNNPGCLGFVLQMFGVKLKNSNDVPNIEESKKLPPYALRDDFLSNAELSFYKVLEQVIDTKVIICPKVSLNDIFYVTERDRSNKTTFHNKISRKHVDFLVCDKVTLKPVYGIELDDSSHKRADRVERDILVEQVFLAAGLPLVRFQNKKAYSLIEVENALSEVVKPNKSNEVEIPTSNIDKEPKLAELEKAEAPNCPKCGSPMILREAKRGEKKGKQFYGCSNFPKCKEVVELF